MADTYPDYPTLPQEWLVDSGAQPTYLDLPGVVLDENIDLGWALSDARVVAGHGDDIAIVHHESGVELTFRDLAAQSDGLADALAAAGIRPGHRVAVRTPNCPEGIVAAIAIWKLGAVLAPVPFIARPSEIAFYLEDTHPTALITDGGADDIAQVIEQVRAAGVGIVLTFGSGSAPDGARTWADAVASAPRRERWDVALDAVAVVWHTGGTTGRPKGCYHTQRRYLLAGLSYGEATGSAPDQRWAAAAPIGHALGLIYHTIFTLLSGATIVMIERFTDPRNVLEAIHERDVTTFTAITATWAALLGELENGTAPEPRTLRSGFAMWQSSSSSEVSDKWRARGVELLNNFGSTAFATWVLIPRLGLPVAQGALGSPAPGYEVRVVDSAGGGDIAAGEIGRMLVRGVSGLTYWRLPAKQRDDVKDGWTHVDDMVRDIGDEVYEYLGRTDFLISTAGNKVAPSEVENVLVGHPAVREVVVVGLPDAVRHEAVAAFVVVEPGIGETDQLRRELQDLVKRELSPYKYPRILEFLPELPRDHVGKVQPKVVRQNALRAAGSDLT